MICKACSHEFVCQAGYELMVIYVKGDFYMDMAQSLYQDIKERTGGEIYIGVVGPVRTGKSTFIKRFMDVLVLPGIKDENDRARTRDELPQSAQGKTIMTTEPKFIPKDAAEVALSDDTQVKLRLIDCVGFMVEGAQGHIENENERMVKTPWFDYEIPFTKAAEIGTQKVINDHSTIGIVVTTDGSIGEISRERYLPAEERTIAELKKIGKPFVILLNSVKPYSAETRELAEKLTEKYHNAVLPVNCEQLKKEDIFSVLDSVLREFPISEFDMIIPKWAEMLPLTHPVKEALLQIMKNAMNKASYMKEMKEKVFSMEADSSEASYIKQVKLDKIELSNGRVILDAQIDDAHYYKLLSDMTGLPIKGEYELVRSMKEFAGMKKEYEKVEGALESVRRKGYGVVAPSREEIELAEPQVIRHGNKFGVKMDAKCPSIHMIKANIETEIAPIVGSEEQAKDLIAYIKENASQSPEGIWTTNIFGKSIEDIVDDGIRTKIHVITEDSQVKLQETLQKIINDSNGGLICIII